MWLKVMGAALVLISSCIAGNIVAGNYLARPQQLRQLRHGLQVLETEISYSLSYLPQALEKVAKTLQFPIAQVFLRTSEFLQNEDGYTAREAWEKALEENLSNLVLLAQDREILLQLGSSFGNTDQDNQLKHLKLAQSYLKNEEEKAEIIGEKNAHLWRYFGLIFGLTVVILLY